MNRAKSTPGPWHFMDDAVFKKKAMFEAAPGITIANTAYNTEPICRVSGYLMPLEANARLIAAAPDLLAACKSAIQAWDDAVYPAPSILTELKAAIQKAEGVE